MLVGLQPILIGILIANVETLDRPEPRHACVGRCSSQEYSNKQRAVNGKPRVKVEDVWEPNLHEIDGEKAAPVGPKEPPASHSNPRPKPSPWRVEGERCANEHCMGLMCRTVSGKHDCKSYIRRQQDKMDHLIKMYEAKQKEKAWDHKIGQDHKTYQQIKSREKQIETRTHVGSRFKESNSRGVNEESNKKDYKKQPVKDLNHMQISELDDLHKTENTQPNHGFVIINKYGRVNVHVHKHLYGTENHGEDKHNGGGVKYQCEDKAENGKEKLSCEDKPKEDKDKQPDGGEKKKEEKDKYRDEDAQKESEEKPDDKYKSTSGHEETLSKTLKTGKTGKNVHTELKDNDKNRNKPDKEGTLPRVNDKKYPKEDAQKERREKPDDKDKPTSGLEETRSKTVKIEKTGMIVHTELKENDENRNNPDRKGTLPEVHYKQYPDEDAQKKSEEKPDDKDKPTIDCEETRSKPVKIEKTGTELQENDNNHSKPDKEGNLPKGDDKTYPDEDVQKESGKKPVDKDKPTSGREDTHGKPDKIEKTGKNVQTELKENDNNHSKTDKEGTLPKGDDKTYPNEDVQKESGENPIDKDKLTSGREDTHGKPEKIEKTGKNVQTELKENDNNHSKPDKEGTLPKGDDKTYPDEDVQKKSGKKPVGKERPTSGRGETRSKLAKIEKTGTDFQENDQIQNKLDKEGTLPNADNKTYPDEDSQKESMKKPDNTDNPTSGLEVTRSKKVKIEKTGKNVHTEHKKNEKNHNKPDKERNLPKVDDKKYPDEDAQKVSGEKPVDKDKPSSGLEVTRSKTVKIEKTGKNVHTEHKENDKNHNKPDKEGNLPKVDDKKYPDEDAQKVSGEKPVDKDKPTSGREDSKPAKIEKTGNNVHTELKENDNNYNKPDKEVILSEVDDKIYPDVDARKESGEKPVDKDKPTSVREDSKPVKIEKTGTELKENDKIQNKLDKEGTLPNADHKTYPDEDAQKESMKKPDNTDNPTSGLEVTRSKTVKIEKTGTELKENDTNHNIPGNEGTLSKVDDKTYPEEDAQKESGEKPVDKDKPTSGREETRSKPVKIEKTGTDFQETGKIQNKLDKEGTLPNADNKTYPDEVAQKESMKKPDNTDNPTSDLEVTRSKKVKIEKTGKNVHTEHKENDKNHNKPDKEGKVPKVDDKKYPDEDAQKVSGEKPVDKDKPTSGREDSKPAKIEKTGKNVHTELKENANNHDKPDKERNLPEVDDKTYPDEDVQKESGEKPVGKERPTSGRGETRSKLAKIEKTGKNVQTELKEKDNNHNKPDKEGILSEVDDKTYPDEDAQKESGEKPDDKDKPTSGLEVTRSKTVKIEKTETELKENDTNHNIPGNEGTLSKVDDKTYPDEDAQKESGEKPVDKDKPTSGREETRSKPVKIEKTGTDFQETDKIQNKLDKEGTLPNADNKTYPDEDAQKESMKKPDNTDNPTSDLEVTRSKKVKIEKTGKNVHTEHKENDKNHNKPDKEGKVPKVDDKKYPDEDAQKVSGEKPVDKDKPSSGLEVTRSKTVKIEKTGKNVHTELKENANNHDKPDKERNLPEADDKTYPDEDVQKESGEKPVGKERPTSGRGETPSKLAKIEKTGKNVQTELKEKDNNHNKPDKEGILSEVDDKTYPDEDAQKESGEKPDDKDKPTSGLEVTRSKTVKIEKTGTELKENDTNHNIPGNEGTLSKVDDKTYPEEDAQKESGEKPVDKDKPTSGREETRSKPVKIEKTGTDFQETDKIQNKLDKEGTLPNADNKTYPDEDAQKESMKKPDNTDNPTSDLEVTRSKKVKIEKTGKNVHTEHKENDKNHNKPDKEGKVPKVDDKKYPDEDAQKVSGEKPVDKDKPTSGREDSKPAKIEKTGTELKENDKIHNKLEKEGTVPKEDNKKYPDEDAQKKSGEKPIDKDKPTSGREETRSKPVKIEKTGTELKENDNNHSKPDKEGTSLKADNKTYPDEDAQKKSEEKPVDKEKPTSGREETRSKPVKIQKTRKIVHTELQENANNHDKPDKERNLLEADDKTYSDEDVQKESGEKPVGKEKPTSGRGETPSKSAKIEKTGKNVQTELKENDNNHNKPDKEVILSKVDDKTYPDEDAQKESGEKPDDKDKPSSGLEVTRSKTVKIEKTGTELKENDKIHNKLDKEGTLPKEDDKKYPDEDAQKKSEEKPVDKEKPTSGREETRSKPMKIEKSGAELQENDNNHNKPDKEGNLPKVDDKKYPDEDAQMESGEKAVDKDKPSSGLEVTRSKTVKIEKTGTELKENDKIHNKLDKEGTLPKEDDKKYPDEDAQKKSEEKPVHKEKPTSGREETRSKPVKIEKTGKNVHTELKENANNHDKPDKVRNLLEADDKTYPDEDVQRESGEKPVHKEKPTSGREETRSKPVKIEKTGKNVHTELKENANNHDKPDKERNLLEADDKTYSDEDAQRESGEKPDDKDKPTSGLEVTRSKTVKIEKTGKNVQTELKENDNNHNKPDKEGILSEVDDKTYPDEDAQKVSGEKPVDKDKPSSGLEVTRSKTVKIEKTGKNVQTELKENDNNHNKPDKEGILSEVDDKTYPDEDAQKVSGEKPVDKDKPSSGLEVTRSKTVKIEKTGTELKENDKIHNKLDKEGNLPKEDNKKYPDEDAQKENGEKPDVKDKPTSGRDETRSKMENQEVNKNNVYTKYTKNDEDHKKFETEETKTKEGYAMSHDKNVQSDVYEQSSNKMDERWRRNILAKPLGQRL